MEQQAIIDFIIVVLGILLALFINKLNEKRNHTKRINNIMTIVIKNMRSDLDTLDTLVGVMKSDDKLYQRYIDSKDLDDKLLIDCKFLAVSVQSFTPTVRGYNLLQDARVDFDFKHSELITDIVHHYNVWKPSLKRNEFAILNACIKNTEDMTGFSWFDSAANHHVNSKEYLDYMRTDQFKQQVVFVQFLKNHYQRHLLDFQKRTLDLLNKSLASNYK
tara:strand:- start:3936 stop:4589 length:654 start_codon:yes stop_codon:yes gene_type:complete